MKNALIAATMLLTPLLQVPPAAAGLWGRGKIPAVWAGKAITVDGNTSDWSSSEAYEKSGLSFKALNDGENLYLSISAHETGADQILSGTTRQDVSIWFLNGKSRDWGVRLPFGDLGDSEARNGSSGTPDPELIVSSGVVISTGVLPVEVKFDGDISSRVPLYELKVPLSSLKPANGRVSVDFVTAYASPELESSMKEKYADAAKKFSASRLSSESHSSFSGDMPQSDPTQGGMSGGGMSRGGGRMHGGMKGGGRHGGSRGGVRQPPELPEPVNMQLSVVLAPKP